jgi:hypothetical protein
MAFQLLYAVIVFALYMNTPQRIYQLYTVWALCALFAVFWCWKQINIGWDDAERNWLFVQDHAKQHIVNGITRYFGTFTDAANFGIHMACASVSFFILAITHKVKHLFQKYISKKVSENLSTIQKELLLIVKNLFILCDSAKREIAKLFFNSLHNGLKILVYGYSMEVIYSLIYARMKGKSFTVYIAKSSSDDGSEKIVEILKKNDIDCNLISYNSISIYLPRIDFILTGAEAICENGGIINKVGTHITSIC